MPNRFLIRPAALPVFLFSFLFLAQAGIVPAAEYPAKPVSLIVPMAAGGGPDATFRMLSSEAEKELGKKIVIVNRPGPGGAAGVSETILSKPDGYTIGMCAVAMVTIQPLLKDLPYKGPEDMLPLVQSNEAPMVLYVKADSPLKTLKDLVEEAKKRPGQISVGIVGGNYNIPHVTLVMLEKKAGIKLNLVPYGSADHVPAVLGGTIEAAMGQVAVMSQHIKAGTVRGLSVFAGRRSERLADIPIVKELGYEILDIPYEFVFAPKGIPKIAIDKLTVAYTKAAKSQTFQEYADKTGIFASYAGPEELAKKLRGDAERYRAIVQELGWKAK
jgi:tripartite-type tricarboxylate transporter receptor subunit TctC